MRAGAPREGCHWRMHFFPAGRGKCRLPGRTSQTTTPRKRSLETPQGRTPQPASLKAAQARPEASTPRPCPARTGAERAPGSTCESSIGTTRTCGQCEMLRHMRITINLSDELILQAKKAALFPQPSPLTPEPAMVFSSVAVVGSLDRSFRLAIP